MQWGQISLGWLPGFLAWETTSYIHCKTGTPLLFMLLTQRSALSTPFIWTISSNTGCSHTLPWNWFPGHHTFLAFLLPPWLLLFSLLCEFLFISSTSTNNGVTLGCLWMISLFFDLQIFSWFHFILSLYISSMLICPQNM